VPAVGPIRNTWPTANGGRIGSGAGAGGSARATERQCGASKHSTDAASIERCAGRADFTRGSQLRGQQLGNLDGVQRRALAQVVARDEQRQAAPVGHPGVLPDAPDQ
jgi:hypothetical protein